jgi:hypothetical protein
MVNLVVLVVVARTLVLLQNLTTTMTMVLMMLMTWNDKMRRKLVEEDWDASISKVWLYVLSTHVML